MRKLISVTFIIAAIVCGCKKQYVGEYASMNAPGVCPTPSFPAECRLEHFTEFVPEVYITKIDDNSNYLIEGSFDGTRGDFKSFNHIVTGESTFKILFINNSRVFDSKNLNLLGTDIGRKLPFKLKYNSKGVEIEAVSFTYKVAVEG